MEPPYKILSILIVFAISPFGLINLEPSKANGCSESIKNKIVKWSISKIESSNMANVSSFTCDYAKNMNKMKSDQIFITSGRNRGKATICLSDEKDYPCKFIIGFINPAFDSAKALSEIYSFTPPQASQLNETVERLFLKPSSLIQ